MLDRAAREGRVISRIIIILVGDGRSSTSDFRKRIRVFENAPRGGGTTVAVPRKGSVEAEERHAVFGRMESWKGEKGGI